MKEENCFDIPEVEFDRKALREEYARMREDMKKNYRMGKEPVKIFEYERQEEDLL